MQPPVTTGNTGSGLDKCVQTLVRQAGAAGRHQVLLRPIRFLRPVAAATQWAARPALFKGGDPDMTLAMLSFTVRLAMTDADIRAACKVRAQAYGHHLPQARQQFAQPDAQDRHRATAIILCRDKQSGDATGTLRIQRSS